MKNRLLFVFFFCFLIIGNLSSIDLDSGGIILPIIIGKTSCSTVSSISIPKQYLAKDGALTLPLNIVIYNDGKSIYKAASTDKVINIPLNLTGTFYVEVSIGSLSFYEKIHI